MTVMGAINQNTLAFLALLISVDVVFIALDVIHTYTTYLSSSYWSLDQDRGYAEVFQYVKEYWVAGILAALFVLKREVVYCAWSLLFVYLLFDDALQIHEDLGGVIVEYFGYSDFIRLRAQDFGELTVSAFVGATFLVLISGGYVLGTPEAKRVCKHLGLLLGILVFFGVFLDMVTIATGSLIIGAVEDGGEMLAVSITCAYVFSLLQQLDRSSHKV